MYRTMYLIGSSEQNSSTCCAILDRYSCQIALASWKDGQSRLWILSNARPFGAGSKIKTAGMIRHALYRPRSNDTVPASISVDYGLEAKEDWSGVFTRFCSLCKPMYAMLHLFDGIELTFGTEEIRRDDFRFGGFHWHFAKHQFPNLAWINLFDGKFRDIADRSALEKDGFHTETIGDGWLLQLTSSIADVQTDYAQFVEVRRKAKKHFPEKFFLIPD
jgi:hypothetical protein